MGGTISNSWRWSGEWAEENALPFCWILMDQAPFQSTINPENLKTHSDFTVEVGTEFGTTSLVGREL